MGTARGQVFFSAQKVRNSTQKLRTVWEDDIKMNFRESSYERTKWMGLAQDHVEWQTLVLTVLRL